MKLVYLSPSGLFDDWARPIQIMKMCEAFSRNGVEVTLVVPRRSIEKKDSDPFKYLNVDKIFKIISIPIIDINYGNPGKLYYWVRWASFLIFSRFYLFFKNYDVLYTRDLYYRLFFRNVYLEQHKFPQKISLTSRFIFKNVCGLIVITEYMKKRMVEIGVKPEKVFVAHDAVRLEDFSSNISKNDARKKFALPLEKIIFGYIGTLKTFNMEKGVSDAISSLKFLPDNYLLCVVGGDPVDVSFYEKYTKDSGLTERVIFKGRYKQELASEYISACDIVIAPYPQNEHYEHYMSPLKIFEYMAGKRPMIVTNLESMREVLRDKETAVFIPPNNPEELAKAIVRISNDSTLSQKLSELAYNEVLEKYTWVKRAENIINFIKS